MKKCPLKYKPRSQHLEGVLQGEDWPKPRFIFSTTAILYWTHKLYLSIQLCLSRSQLGFPWVLHTINVWNINTRKIRVNIPLAKQYICDAMTKSLQTNSRKPQNGDNSSVFSASSFSSFSSSTESSTPDHSNSSSSSEIDTTSMFSPTNGSPRPVTAI
jgi:hypothetical protein